MSNEEQVEEQEQTAPDLAAADEAGMSDEGLRETFLAAAEAATSKEEVDSFLKAARALRSFVHIHKGYLQAPDESLAELLSGMQLDAMKMALMQHPEHAVELLEVASSFIVQSMLGITFEQWLGMAGLSADPAEQDEEASIEERIARRQTLMEQIMAENAGTEARAEADDDMGHPQMPAQRESGETPHSAPRPVKDSPQA